MTWQHQNYNSGLISTKLSTLSAQSNKDVTALLTCSRHCRLSI